MEARRHLLSSPSRSTMQAEALVILSSSPDFPSIDELLPKPKKKPLLRSGSRAAPIPETALKSFTTASHFWHSTIAEEDESAVIGEGDVTHQEKVQNVMKRARSVPRDVVSHEVLVEHDHDLHGQGATTAPSDPTVQEKPAKGTTRQKPKSVLAPESAEELGLSPKEKPWKKYKGKDAADGQTKIPKGKITKPIAAKPKQTRKKAETVSKHFTTAVAPEPIDIDDHQTPLEPALKRRTDWTPTKNTEQPIILLDSSTVKDVTSPRLGGADASLQPRQDIFKSLRDTYSCPDLEDVGRTAVSLQEHIDVLGKRKLIEMVTTGETTESKTPEESPVKQKAPKKKPRTITELATAAYRVAETADFPGIEEQSRDESLLNYFDTSEESVLALAAKDKAVPGKAKSPKTGAKAKPKRVSKKKTEPPQPILLSPASAIRQVSRQDFVFGTSSQLATEVDAGLLRDLHQAMKDSNQREEYDPFASSPTENDFTRKSSGHRLWGAGARNEDGDLLEVEVIDLVDSPAIEKDLTNPSVILSLATDAAADQDGSMDSRCAATLSKVDVISLSSSLTPTHPKPRFSILQKQPNIVAASSVPAGASSGAGHQSFMQAATATTLDEDPPASNQEQYHQMASSAPDASAPASHEAPAPKYELFTDAQLAKEVQSYGFKPIKRRTAAIALLVQCWSSKNQTRTQTLGQGTNASLSTSSMAAAKAKPSAPAPAAAKPRGRPKKVASTAEPSESASASAPVPAPESATKRPRGRPKKNAVSDKIAVAKKPSKTTTKRSSLSPPPAAAASGPAPGPSTPKRKRQAPAQPAIEIADSDQEEMDPFDLSSAASSPAPANEFSSPAPGVDLSMTEADDSVLSLTSSPTSQQARLFAYITDAVRTAPRSKDPQNPSWHEKMLLYDPIVLEDLAAWLNAGQLDRVGCEEEVSCGDVKKWCESKSVCCLWKVNLNGKERKRF
ncbi:hypothetical protein CONLIGDRAFT_637128 [Coniochaeta ligniaria NRRL 30616]|uniref:Structure-specific endonuclease subunit SLX4 n=1 Tax=Coniochaeta ligniaria NRRL 30616 TaxID=1408157 RepID=A0A1J7I8B7_9PEZI|nr:hypothetical protein CONLIGDRAFT_637128 [Coniochaeta ligniaria NRRL 30616]